jgi:hypothetical protein
MAAAPAVGSSVLTRKNRQPWQTRWRGHLVLVLQRKFAEPCLHDFLSGHHGGDASMNTMRSTADVANLITILERC